MNKANEIINIFLLVRDKFMPELHLRQSGSFKKSGFTYSTCGPFTKNREKIQKFMETGDTRYIYRNELDKFFNMIWHIISKISKEELILIKF